MPEAVWQNCSRPKAGVLLEALLCLGLQPLGLGDALVLVGQGVAPRACPVLVQGTGPELATEPAYESLLLP